MANSINAYFYRIHKGGTDPHIAYDIIGDDGTPLSMGMTNSMSGLAYHLTEASKEHDKPLRPINGAPLSHREDFINGKSFFLTSPLDAQDMQRLAVELSQRLSGK